MLLVYFDNRTYEFIEFLLTVDGLLLDCNNSYEESQWNQLRNDLLDSYSVTRRTALRHFRFIQVECIHIARLGATLQDIRHAVCNPISY